MDQLLRAKGGLKSSPYYLVFIEFFGPKKFNVFKVLRKSNLSRLRMRIILNTRELLVLFKEHKKNG